LTRVPASLLKIDGRFVRGIHAEEESQLVPAIILLAHDLGLTALAEGVEQEADLATLRELGCDLAQGYAVGRAMGSSNIASKLRG
jgi:EAL domain-containing protein (putative c-di-GMP-specific phosphodiesterase class I)